MQDVAEGIGFQFQQKKWKEREGLDIFLFRKRGETVCTFTLKNHDAMNLTAIAFFFSSSTLIAIAGKCFFFRKKARTRPKKVLLGRGHQLALGEGREKSF